MSHLGLLLILLGLKVVYINSQCLSPYQLCETGECALSPNACGQCKPGQYICPDQTTCVQNAAAYVDCPNLKGTHFDWTLPLEQRLNYLVNNATLQEKYTQLTNDAPEIYRLGIPAYNWLNDDEHGVRNSHATVFPDGCGLGATWSKKDLYNVGNITAYEARALYNAHVNAGDRGTNENGATISIYSPNLNLVRDPRWGRSQEVYSEDPLLTGKLTYHYVTGLQFGNKQNNSYLLTAACCKHFAAYDLESDPVPRYYFNALVNSRNWAETYSPAFRACVVEAHGAHVMCSYNSVNGVPACGNGDLLNTVLRGQWGFPGFVVSDYDAMAQIYETHSYADSYTQAVSIAITNGCDQEGGGTIAIDQIPEAISEGLLTEAEVDQSFSRLFAIRIELGLLDPPTFVEYNYLKNDSSVAGSAHIEMTRVVASHSVCVYKNEQKTLPLDADAIQKLIVIGPQAIGTDLLLGNYATYPDEGVTTIVEGLRSALGESSNASCTFLENVDFYQPGQTGQAVFDAAECCSLCFQDDFCNYWTFYESNCYLKQTNQGQVNSTGRISGMCLNKPNNGNSRVAYQPGCESISCPSTTGFASALSLVKQTFANGQLSAVLVIIGLDQTQESEGHDRSVIELPGNQNALIETLWNFTSPNNIPLLCLMIHGGTLALGKAAGQCDAVLDGWYPGMRGGFGIADVIFGSVNPAGRATVTYYQSTSDLPTPGEMDEYAENGVTYRYYRGEPLYPFGYGLSYTTFSYSNLRTNITNSNNEINPCDVVKFTVTVTNTGSLDGDEVVQLYVQQADSSVPVPNVRLADFERVFVEAGTSVDVDLILTPRYRSSVYQDENSVWYVPNVVIEDRIVDVFVGGGQPKYYEKGLKTLLTVTSSASFSTCANQN